MKFLFVAVIVNIFVQSSSFRGTLLDVMSPGDDDQLLFSPHFEYQLTQQYLKRQIAIERSWMECNDFFTVPIDEAKIIFQNRDARYVSDQAKCLIDCTLRGTGVITDDGLDEEVYMLHIKQLRYNYTAFDINERSDEAKRKMLETISNRATGLTTYSVRRPDFYDQLKCRTRRPYRNICYDLVWSYTLAARKCKTLRDAGANDCETSWMIVQCIMEENRKRLFDSPFYPVKLKPSQ